MYPTPSATATAATKAPSELPSTLSRPPTLRSDSERPITNSTLGPGMRMIGIATSANASRLAAGIMPSRLDPPASRQVARDVAHEHERARERDNADHSCGE